MATSSIPAVKAALITRLQARAGLYGVSVTWGFTDAAGARAAEWVFVGNTRGDQTWTQQGRQSKEEDYTLDLIVSVVRKGLGVQTAEQRAWAIAAEVENELRSDPSVGLTPPYRLLQAQVEGPVVSEEAVSEDGSAVESRITLSIRVETRI
jgi:hypothetical protein